MFNECITVLFVTEEYEAGDAGKELTAVLLLYLAAGFLAKGFLAWV